MRFRRRFRVRASLEQVVRYHQKAATFTTLTPTVLRLRLEPGPQTLAEGDEVGFSFWLGPLRVRWRARIEAISPGGFSDRQLEGPFESWIHLHSFRALDGGTEVTDEIEAELRRQPVWAAAGLAIWLFLPVMFAYRSRETRRALESRPAPRGGT